MKRMLDRVTPWLAGAIAVLAIVSPVLAQDDGTVAGPLQTLLGQPLIAMFFVIAVGMLVGRITVAGVSLGTSGVLFAALIYGAWRSSVATADAADPVGETFAVLGRMGLVLFVYCIGIAAGPTFFQAFSSQAKNLVRLGIVLVAIGAVVTFLGASLFHVSTDLAVGIFAGAMTSTPALAAAAESVAAAVKAGDGSVNAANVAVGYGIAYPVGVIGVVLFVQLLPRLLRKDLTQLSQEAQTEQNHERRIVRVLVKVTNPSVFGKTLDQTPFIAESTCQVSRQLEGEKLVPIKQDFRFEKDQHVLVVGRAHRVRNVLDYLGTESDIKPTMDTERERRRIVATSAEITGRSLHELDLLRRFGVTVSRIARMDVEFVPPNTEVIQNGDLLTVVGDPQNLERFAHFAGDRSSALHETDVISLAIGVTAGIVLGMIPFTLPGAEGSFKLGLAGGPLLIALVLGHFGRVGGIVGRMPRASRIVMMELGLVFFLADAGSKAGGEMLSVLQTQGSTLILVGAAITFVPMIVGYLFATYFLKMPLLEVLGAVCGGMTSTPGLGAITAKTDSDIPVISYAAAYPAALILMTVFAKLIVSILT